MISEPKLGFLQGFWEPNWFCRNQNGEGIIAYIGEDTPSRVIEVQSNVEYFFIEINLRKK